MEQNVQLRNSVTTCTFAVHRQREQAQQNKLENCTSYSAAGGSIQDSEGFWREALKSSDHSCYNEIEAGDCQKGRNRRWLSNYLGRTLISVAIWAVFCKNSDISLKKKIVIRARR
jgi:hypothetical protein